MDVRERVWAESVDATLPGVGRLKSCRDCGLLLTGAESHPIDCLNGSRVDRDCNIIPQVIAPEIVALELPMCFN